MKTKIPLYKNQRNKPCVGVYFFIEVFTFLKELKFEST